jgi:hypothetical protein
MAENERGQQRRREADSRERVGISYGGSVKLPSSLAWEPS